VLAFARPGRLGPVPPRRAFDAWLLTAAPALALCAVFVVYRWPLVFQGWDAHGLGAEGGEANAALFPWLHGLLWISLTTPRGGRRAGGQSEPNSRRP
jgi:hypothetical protein